MPDISFDSPFYPFEKVVQGANSMAGAERLPLKILLYLMDMADERGYVPTDDNSRPRVRLMKYLYYDGANPLMQPLPTDEQKRSLLFDGDHAVLNTNEEQAAHPLGYRLYPQSYWGQSELDAKAFLKCYIGRVIPRTPFCDVIGLTFELCVNYALNNVTRTNAYSRLWNMECALIAALHGVNIDGAGVIDYSRGAHGDAGSRPFHDEGTHIYRVINMSLDWMQDSDRGKIESYYR